MSQQQQTVRITTTETTSSSALVINTGYLGTPPGLLKLAQFVNIVQSIVITMKNKIIVRKLQIPLCIYSNV